ncbi:unnamed protein product [Peronospora destructor]|uniref:WW domain-containing protein n=1 Tax=Peronospora destructor TaxID=86335 RepID=A0AAV0U494_9STRA|nr:unnamed protein product [Peronospora destructor]
MATKEAGAGTKCYVPDETYVWLPAQILREMKSSDPKKPEKTLVLRVFPPPGDRNSCIGDEERVLDFNDSKLLAASDSKERWFLEDVNKCYAYTGANKTIKIEGISDSKHFERTKTALGLIGVTKEQQRVLFEVLAGVIHLGQLEIQSKNNNEESEIVPDNQGAKNATKLLGISTENLEKALCSRQIAVVGDKQRKTDVSFKQRCEALMKTMELSSPEQYQIGFSRIYFRYGILEQMEDKKAIRLDLQARHLQHYMRGFCCRLRFLCRSQAIVKLQSVARCVIMMNRYQSFKAAVILLQAHWRGYDGRCAAFNARKNNSAIIIQKYARRFTKRKQFTDARKIAVKIQAFLRMKNERPKYIKALQKKKQQADMEYQLNKLQERLHDEQRRNAVHHAESKKDRLSSSSTDDQLSAETTARERSTAHVWMADADGIINQLNEETGRLRKENEEQRALTAQLKREVKKLKFDQTVLSANFQVKIRGFQDTIREKDKKLEAVERECVKLRGSVSSDAVFSSQKSMRKDRRSVFRRLGAKKESENGYDNGDASQASTVLQAALAERSAETAQFLRESARRLTLWGGDSAGENRYSGSDMGDSGGHLSLLQEVGAARVGAMDFLKNKLTAVKDKYYGEEGSSAASRQHAHFWTDSAARESLNLDTLPLPSGWEMRQSRSKGKQYYCNPTLRITQWDHPSIDASKAKKQEAAAVQRVRIGTSTVGSPPRDSIDGILTMNGQI